MEWPGKIKSQKDIPGNVYGITKVIRCKRSSGDRPNRGWLQYRKAGVIRGIVRTTHGSMVSNEQWCANTFLGGSSGHRSVAAHS